MPLLNSIISWVNVKRLHQIELFKKYPFDVQQEVFFKLVEQASKTTWGVQYGFESINAIQDYQRSVPISTYDDLKPYINRLREGEQNLLWPSEIKWFAKSSGTTADKSKFIPVSFEALEECHFRGGKDVIAFYMKERPENGILKGKGLTLGGSAEVNKFSNQSYFGDLSAVIIENLPFWAQFIRTPAAEIALIPDFEHKLERIIEHTIHENVTSIAGVPSWNLVLLKAIVERTGKSNILEIWPNLELFTHGGIPMDRYDEPNRPVYTIDEVELGINYALVITTNGGLWRYLIGDTVIFTSLFPHRIKISGRTTYYINAFGEEVILDNAEKALMAACRETGAIVKEYTAGPLYMSSESKGAHEWMIEFETAPENLDRFRDVLDKTLANINSDYEAKRYKNITLKKPIIVSLEPGTFYRWMQKRGKLGGQNKIPRLSNDRKYLDELSEL
ncbi:MAG: GH3 auxin-responsive promoter family protein, partial [bacterium]